MRQLLNEDREELLKFLNEEPTRNLFFIGDLYTYGMENPCQYYGSFEGKHLISTMLIYRDSIIHVAYNSRLTPEDIGFIEYQCRREEIRIINFFPVHLPELEYIVKPYLKTDSATYFAVYEPNDFRCDTAQVAELKEDDVPSVIELEKSAFGRTEASTAHYADDVREGRTVMYGVKDGTRVVTSASLVARTDSAGMIVGVATYLEYRGKGYASATVYKLCQDFYCRGVQCVLFFNNPAAGRIYHRLGFKDLDQYYIVLLKESQK